MSLRSLVGVILIIIVVGRPSPTAAQDTREAVIAAAQAEKQKTPPPLTETSSERVVDKIDRFAKASIPPGSRQSADRAMARVGFRADVVRQRLPEIDAWLRARP